MPTLLLLLACSRPAYPPAQPAPVEVEVEVEVDLTCPRAFGTIATHPAGELDHAPPHPDPTLPAVAVSAGSSDRYVIGLEEGDGGWSASVDLDRDGTIREAERLPIASETSPRAAGVFPAFALPATTRSGTPTTVAARIRTSVHPDGPRIAHVELGCGGRGTLPDGTPFGIEAESGVLDHDDTRVVLDLDGDGNVDFDNRLASVTLAEGVVPYRGQPFRMGFETDPPRLVLTPTDAPVTGLRVGAPAPAFQAVGTDGEVHDLARYRSKPLLLDFWATWCAPCIAAHPDVVALHEEFDIAVLGISADDDNEVVRRWLPSHPTPWPSIAEGPAGATHHAYGVSSWPTYALIDAEGRLVVLGDLSAVRPALAALPH